MDTRRVSSQSCTSRGSPIHHKRIYRQSLLLVETPVTTHLENDILVLAFIQHITSSARSPSDTLIFVNFTALRFELGILL